LNQIFGWSWSWEVLDKFRDGNEVVVQGRLSIKDKSGTVLITKEDFGCKQTLFLKSKPDQPVSIGNDYKAATTDALKRCARQIGIASDVYGDDFKTSNDVSNIIYEEEQQQDLLDALDEINKANTVEELESIVVKHSKLLKNKAVAKTIATKKESLCE
jgi:hypothetical protein